MFGKTFAMYDKAEMLRFIEPFKIRFERNKINPNELFKGKKCLDAGCGGGRGSIFMAMHGAREVLSIDVSPINIESTQRNAKIFGFLDIISAQLSSLESIPFENETFDFVWCNGVLMHTHSPDECLKELARVLRIGGSSWIYVYGAGGVYWYCVYKFREMLKNCPESDCMNAMKFFQIPVQFLAEYMDNWKAPYLRTYTNSDFSTRLSELGFENLKPLLYGTDYDTSHRINTFSEDAFFLGDGDLRYLLKKTKNKLQSSNEHCISDSVWGSDYQYSDKYTKTLDEKFKELEELTQGSLLLKILAFAYIQRHLRDEIFSLKTNFDFNLFVRYFEECIALLQSIK